MVWDGLWVIRCGPGFDKDGGGLCRIIRWWACGIFGFVYGSRLNRILGLGIKAENSQGPNV